MTESGVDAPTGPFSQTWMAVALMHRFIHFDRWFAAEIASGVIDVAEIARVVFPD